MQYGHNLPNYSSQEHHFMNQDLKVNKTYNKLEKEREESMWFIFLFSFAFNVVIIIFLYKVSISNYCNNGH